MKIIQIDDPRAPWLPLYIKPSAVAPPPAPPPEPQAPWEHAHVAAQPQAGTLAVKPFLRAAHIVRQSSAETALLAEACALAYWPADEIRASLKAPGFTDVALFRKPPSADFETGPVTGRVGEGDTGPVRAFGFCDDRRAFLAFRGTQGLGDWVYNLSTWTCDGPGRHAGFQRAWNGVAPWIREWLGQVMPERRSLFLAGHSLGGAIATIAAWELARMHPIRGIVTLGSPRVGGEAFATLYGGRAAASAPDKTRRTLRDVTERYQHGIDIVARNMPPPIYFAHVAPVLELPPRTIDEVKGVRLEAGTVTGLQIPRETKFKVLRPDSGVATELSGRVVASHIDSAFAALGIVAGLAMLKLGFTAIVPFLNKLGPLSERAYHGGMHHRSVIYATLLSPSKILGDWLNRPARHEPSLWPLAGVVAASVVIGYALGGVPAALWTAAACAVSIPVIGLIAVKVDSR